MADIKCTSEVTLEIDVLEELNDYLYLFGRWKLRDNKLQSCSPFRTETNPSFAVNLENGTWIDSGSTDDRFKKGGFVSLLMYLRNETFPETMEYLSEKYVFDWSRDTQPDLEIAIELAPSPTVLPKSVFAPYLFRSTYLEGRHISTNTQNKFSIGYDVEHKAIAIPWFDYKGNLVNIKFRSVESKKFWYLPDGDRVHDHIYGLHLLKRNKAEYAFLVESEIDAMTFAEVGEPALAFGGSHLSKRQEWLLKSVAGLRRVILASDNDGVGQAFRKQLEDRLGGLMQVDEFNIPENYKDINDIPIEELRELIHTNIITKDIVGAL